MKRCTMISLSVAAVEAARLSLLMSVEETQLKAGVSKDAMTKVRAGRPVSLRVARRIATALRTPLRKLLADASPCVCGSVGTGAADVAQLAGFGNSEVHDGRR